MWKLEKIKNWKKEKSQSKEQCGCNSLDDCPHTPKTMKNCKYDKRNCLIVNDKKNREKNDYTNLRICFFISLGLLLYVFSSIKPFTFDYSNYVYMIISGVSISAIAGAILAKVIDLPSKLKDYETSFINALASNSYLKSLDEERLTKLRNDITKQLHKVSAPNMATGLIEIDGKICDLLRQPYYSRYRQCVICEPKKEDPNYVIKKHFIDYQLINPYGVNKETNEYITLRNLVLLPDYPDGTTQNAKNVIRNLKINCIKDNADNLIEYKEGSDFELKEERINSNKEYYNTKIYLDSPQKSSEKKEGIRIDFKKEIRIHMEYEIDVNVEDKCFTKRLKHPVQNFRLDYSCNDMPNTQLHGQIFGTQLKQANFSIQNPTPSSISLEAFDWLLPDNGAIVVMLNNVK